MEAVMNEQETGAEEVVEPTMDEVAGVAVETQAEETTAAAEPEVVQATEEASPPQIDEQSDPAQDAVQKRINKITADKYAEKRRADELEAKLKALEASKAQAPMEAPQLENFDYDEGKYQEALIEYRVQKALQTQQELTIKQQQEQARQKVINDFTAKEAEYLSQHPEYKEEVAKLPVFNKETLNAIFELGPQVSHYLAKHLDIASEVASVSPTMAAVRLGQISMGLTADSKKIKPSAAPEPVKTIAGGASISKSQEEMSMDEIMALP